MDNKYLKQDGDKKTEEITAKTSPQPADKTQQFQISTINGKFDLRTVIEVPKPKRIRQARLFFFKEHLGCEVKEDDLKQSEKFKKVAAEWSLLNSEDKQKYELQADQDKLRYQQ